MTAPNRPLSVPMLAAASTYIPIAEIASGGMAKVYVCRKSGQAGFRRLFALKVMHPHLAEDDEYVRMLLDEADLAAGLHHPNVVGIVDLGRSDRSYYIVMEYVDGCSLHELLRRSPKRPASAILPIALDVLAGLEAAHSLTDSTGQSRQLVHRDVSPHNILVGRDGQARLTDFGVAKATSRLTHTAPGLAKGKLDYMSPEQVRDEELDHRADLFSFGVVLWSALTGERLFRGTSDAATLENILRKEIPKPSEVGAKPPAVLDDIVLWALARDRQERPESAGALARRLREVALEHGLLGSPAEVSEWVEEAVGDILTARRDAIRESMRSDAPPAAFVIPVGGSPIGFPPTRGNTLPTLPAFEVTPSVPPSVVAPTNHDAPIDDPVIDEIPTPTLPPRGRVSIGSAIAIGALTALLFAAWWRLDEADAAAPPPKVAVAKIEHATPDAEQRPPEASLTTAIAPEPRAAPIVETTEPELPPAASPPRSDEPRIETPRRARAPNWLGRMERNPYLRSQ